VPSVTWVGQVAVQKPQWTHLRRIFSEVATCGSASCSGVKLVCISGGPPRGGRWHTPLCPAGHLPHKGGDRLGARPRHDSISPFVAGLSHMADCRLFSLLPTGEKVARRVG